MKIKFAATIILACLANTASATTVTLSTATFTNSVPSDEDFLLFDSSDQSDAFRRSQAQSADGSHSAEAGVASMPNDGRTEMALVANGPIFDAPYDTFASAAAENELPTFVAVGTGTITATLQISGQLALAGSNDFDKFFDINYTLISNGPNTIESLFDYNDPVAADGTFFVQAFSLFVVEDGDEVDFYHSLAARVGTPFGGDADGFVAAARINSLFTFETTDGLTLVERDQIAPVPLPAAFPMLLAGLGALGMMRRRARSSALR